MAGSSGDVGHHPHPIDTLSLSLYFHLVFTFIFFFLFSHLAFLEGSGEGVDGVVEADVAAGPGHADVDIFN
jgi:hypothetical protein